MNPLNILRDAFFFFSRNISLIARLCLPLVALECITRAALTSQFDPAHAPAYGMLIGLVFYPLYSAALILLLDARSQNHRPRIRDLLAASLPIWPSFAVLAGLSTLLIMLAASVFVLPALWVMVKLAFAEYLLVLRGLTPLQAMRESFQLTTGHFWSLLACVLLVIVPLWLLDNSTLRLVGEQPDVIDRLLLDCINSFLQLFSTVVLFRCFMLCTPQATQDSTSH